MRWWSGPAAADPEPPDEDEHVSAERAPVTAARWGARWRSGFISLFVLSAASVVASLYFAYKATEDFPTGWPCPEPWHIVPAARNEFLAAWMLGVLIAGGSILAQRRHAAALRTTDPMVSRLVQVGLAMTAVAPPAAWVFLYLGVQLNCGM